MDVVTNSSNRIRGPKSIQELFVEDYNSTSSVEPPLIAETYTPSKIVLFWGVFSRWEESLVCSLVSQNTAACFTQLSAQRIILQYSKHP